MRRWTLEDVASLVREGGQDLSRGTAATHRKGHVADPWVTFPARKSTCIVVHISTGSQLTVAGRFVAARRTYCFLVQNLPP